jgi:tetratricopeptide (TPR) repeat protein
LALLPEAGRQVIEALAVLDAPATPDQLQEVSGRSEDETYTALDLALRRGLLQPGAGLGRSGFDFSHDLMREVVVGQLTAVRRQRLHRRAAQRLERAGAPAATLAFHWQMAGDVAKEGAYAALAGEQAAATYANQAAIRYLERALHLIEDGEQRLRLMARLGETRMVTGDWDQAESLFGQVLSLAEARGNRASQARAQAALGKLMSRRGRYQQALGWLEQARGNWQAVGDVAGLAGIVGTLGIVYWQMDDYEQARACYHQALDLCTRLGDKAGIAIWTANLGGLHLLQGEHQLALAHHEQALRLYHELGMQREIGIATGNLGNIFVELRAYRRALGYHLEALRIRRELEDKAGVATTLNMLGGDYAALGAHHSALACFQAALAVWLELVNWEGIALQLGRLGEVLGDLGDTPSALAYLDRSIELFRRLGSPHYLSEQLAARAELLAVAGDLVAAQASNAEALAAARGINPEVEFTARLRALRLAVLLGITERPAAAHAMLALLDEFGRPPETAAVLYEAWRAAAPAPDAARHAARAAELYAALLAETGFPEYARRLAELTGTPAPALPAPPPLPDIDEYRPADLAGLLGQVDALLAAQPL